VLLVRLNGSKAREFDPASQIRSLPGFALFSFQEKNHACSAFQWLSTPFSLTNTFHRGKDDASSRCSLREDSSSYKNPIIWIIQIFGIF